MKPIMGILLAALSLFAAEAPRVFTLKNAKGMEVRVTNYGGVILSWTAPDRKGNYADVVLGFDTPQDYIAKADNPYFGALIGRYGNRIAKAQFSIDGTVHRLAANNNGNALHGGIQGFSKRLWAARHTGAQLTLDYTSADGEEGYPGELKVRAVYTLGGDNSLTIRYEATTNKPTVLNLTNHSYFNLAGTAAKDILGHELKLHASSYTPVDAGLIPTGEIRSVKGTPFDFLKPIAIGARIDAKDEQIRLGGGYDHNFVLDKTRGGGAQLAAEVYEPITGRVLEVFTSKPGVQFYTGNFLDGGMVGKQGIKYTKRKAFCLETQHYPDSPNQPKFPTTLLKPGQTYRSTTIYKFSAR
jgi:aldose 1-epimerase